MSTIDRQRVAAVNTLVELGFAFRDGSWHPPLPTTVEPAEAEFLAKVSHVRPPLNAVLILADGIRTSSYRGAGAHKQRCDRGQRVKGLAMGMWVYVESVHER